MTGTLRALEGHDQRADRDATREGWRPRTVLPALIILFTLLALPAPAEDSVLAPTPDLRIVGWIVDDSYDGAGDGGLHPGETAYLQISLSNLGTADAWNVAGTLYEVEDHPEIEILDKFATWPPLYATGSAAATNAPHFKVRAAASRPCAWEIPLRLELTAAGYTVERTFTLVMVRPRRTDLAVNAARGFIYAADPGDRAGQAVAAGSLRPLPRECLVIGSPYADGPENTRSSAGEAAVIWADLASYRKDIDIALASPFIGRIFGADPDDFLGSSVATGDLNGDGAEDLIVSAPGGDGPEPADARPGAGEVVIWFGWPLGWFGSIDLATHSAQVSEIRGRDAGDGLGDSLAVCDLNGDGFDELIIGAGEGDGTGGAKFSAGEVVLVYGTTTGIGDTDLALPAPTNVSFIYGADEYDELGNAVACADLDADGYDDLVLAAEWSDGPYNERTDAGEVVVLYGRPERYGDLDLGAPSVAVSRIYGASRFDRLGYGMASGDVDGDGYDDLILGAKGDGPDNQRAEAGELAVIYGGPNRQADLDLASRPAGVTFLYGADAGDELGLRAVASADLDGDGIDEIVAGASRADGPEPADARADAGEVAVVYGGPDRQPAIDLAAAPPSVTIVHGVNAGDFLGASVAAGDVDFDGFGDLLVGAPEADGPVSFRAESGEVAMLPGGPVHKYRHDPDAYAFIDATAGPAVAVSCDDCSATIPIGFSFDFYGRKFSAVTVSSNGYLTFGDAANSPGAFCPPQSNAPNNVIAVFWDDLNPGAGGAVHSLLEGVAPNRRLTVEWRNVPLYPNVGAATFEVTLFESSNQILLQYQDTTFGNGADNGATAVAGIENAIGWAGAAVSCFRAGLAGGSAIRLRPFGHESGGDPFDVEGDVSDWTLTGLWHVTDNTSVCTPNSRSGSRSFYYGREASCSVQTGLENSGDLTSPLVENLAQDAAVVFWQRRNVQDSSPSRHLSLVQVQAGGAPYATVGQVTSDANEWFFSEDILAPDPENGSFAGIDLSAYAGQDLRIRFRFDTVDSLFNDVLGWMLDDLDLYTCPVWGGGGGGVASDARATAQPSSYCEGAQGRVDALGSYCAACPALEYQWKENGAPVAGATGVAHTIPRDKPPAVYDYTVEIGCASNPGCFDASNVARVDIVMAPVEVGPTLTVEKASGGTELLFRWSDAAGAADYALFSDSDPADPFGVEVGAAASGAAGIMLPMPAESIAYYLVAGRNPTCGLGPLR